MQCIFKPDYYQARATQTHTFYKHRVSLKSLSMFVDSQTLRNNLLFDGHKMKEIMTTKIVAAYEAWIKFLRLAILVAPTFTS